jgi:hypothetical protein
MNCLLRNAVIYILFRTLNIACYLAKPHSGIPDYEGSKSPDRVILYC